MSTAIVIVSGWAASPGSASPPISSARARVRASSRSATATRAPAAVSRRAASAPMPDAPPVTSAALPCEIHQQLLRKVSSTRVPNFSASTGTRSSMPWNSEAKSRSGGSRSGANP